MLKPKKLSRELRELSDRCKRRIVEFEAIPTDMLLKQVAKSREDLGF